MKKSLLVAWVILLISMPIHVFSQTRAISGTVKNKNGEPIPHATVQVKGTDNATTADENGRFAININSDNAILLISSVNYEPTEISVSSSNSYAIVLNDVANLTEVVVTSLGIRKEKKALGYSVQEVKGSDLVASRQTNIVNALRGKVAGVQINSGGGAPGQGSHIIIRGVKSLSPGKNNQPLFVIDGLQMDNSTNTVSSSGELRGLSNRAADINPDDIETITILRGGAATALYGQAGSNGVVVITTKSAKAGKMRINFSSTYGIDKVNKFPDVQDQFTQGYVGAVTRLPLYNPSDFSASSYSNECNNAIASSKSFFTFSSQDVSNPTRPNSLSGGPHETRSPRLRPISSIALFIEILFFLLQDTTISNKRLKNNKCDACNNSFTFVMIKIIYEDAGETLLYTLKHIYSASPAVCSLPKIRMFGCYPESNRLPEPDNGFLSLKLSF